MDEILFNKESKSGTWEIISDSSKDKVSLFYFTETGDEPSQKIEMNKKEFHELKRFLKYLKLEKNYNVKLHKPENKYKKPTIDFEPSSDWGDRNRPDNLR